MRKAKIICTIGPASDSPEVLDRLIAHGMNAARLNFSHGSHESHERAIRTIREAASRRAVAIAIIQDLQGPRIRVGTVGPEGLTVETDQPVRLVPAQGDSDPRSGIHFAGRSVAAATTKEIPVTYDRLAQDLQPNARVLIDDGSIELTVRRIAEPAVECVVIRGGRISSRKGINLPGTVISEPTLTDKDRDDLRFGLSRGVDYVALSFVRSPDDVAGARKLVAELGAEVPLIAKIERPEAVACMEDLLAEADGVMVARGDLGVEMGPEAVPLLQKRIITEANRRRRLVITATQMLESMTQNQHPTRAEASDVANAVFDGTDAVMLSAETSAGRYPVESVRVMDRLVRAAEAGTDLHRARVSESGRGDSSITEAVCEAACNAAAAIGAAAIVAFTESGATARLLSKWRPVPPIVGLTPSETVRQRMGLYPGVLPFTMSRIVESETRVAEVERHLKEHELVHAGDRLVIVSGTSAGRQGGTNTIKLHEVT